MWLVNCFENSDNDLMLRPIDQSCYDEFSTGAQASEPSVKSESSGKFTSQTSAAAAPLKKFQPLEETLFRFQGQLYVPVKYILENQNQIRNECQRYMADSQSSERFRRRWSQELSSLFALIVTVLGFKTVKPKQIETAFPKHYQLNATMLGSHLQKYKLKVQRKYKLESFDQIQNWMVLDYGDDELARAAEAWRDPAFEGFSDHKIFELIAGRQ